MNRQRSPFRIATVLLVLPFVGVIALAATASSSEAAGEQRELAHPNAADEDNGEIREEGPSEDQRGGGRGSGGPCPVDAGGTNLPNGTACSNDRQCASGFCSTQNGVCQACDGSCGERSIHGQDVVNECVNASGQHFCSSEKHYPCAGTHNNTQYERCIPAPGGQPIIRRGTGVRCQGGAPVVVSPCDGTMTTSCGTGGPYVMGLWDNNRPICP